LPFSNLHVLNADGETFRWNNYSYPGRWRIDALSMRPRMAGMPGTKRIYETQIHNRWFGFLVVGRAGARPRGISASPGQSRGNRNHAGAGANCTVRHNAGARKRSWNRNSNGCGGDQSIDNRASDFCGAGRDRFSGCTGWTGQGRCPVGPGSFRLSGGHRHSTPTDKSTGGKSAKQQRKCGSKRQCQYSGCLEQRRDCSNQQPGRGLEQWCGHSTGWRRIRHRPVGIHTRSIRNRSE
jgi:hypothetical protein